MVRVHAMHKAGEGDGEGAQGISWLSMIAILPSLGRGGPSSPGAAVRSTLVQRRSLSLTVPLLSLKSAFVLGQARM